MQTAYQDTQWLCGLSGGAGQADHVRGL
jgi:hypothetical protein